MPNLEQTRRKLASYVALPAGRLLAKTPLSPDVLTWMGFLLTVAAAVLVAMEHFIAAGIVYLVAALFDMLDGALARATDRSTKFGSILDSSLDRLSEGAMLLGIMFMFAQNDRPWDAFLAGLTLLASYMVSYVRARIEVTGMECKAGFFTRPERVIVLALGVLLAHFHYSLVIALGIITGLSIFSTTERLLYAWRHTRK